MPAAANESSAGELDVAGRREPLADQAHRADPGLVGAADAVGVVVGVVHPDLQRQGDDEGEDAEGDVRPPDEVGGGGAEDDGGDGGGQGARAGARHPLGQGGHVGVRGP